MDTTPAQPPGPPSGHGTTQSPLGLPQEHDLGLPPCSHPTQLSPAGAGRALGTPGSDSPGLPQPVASGAGAGQPGRVGQWPTEAKQSLRHTHSQWPSAVLSQLPAAATHPHAPGFQALLGAPGVPEAYQVQMGDVATGATELVQNMAYLAHIGPDIGQIACQGGVSAPESPPSSSWPPRSHGRQRTGPEPSLGPGRACVAGAQPQLCCPWASRKASSLASFFWFRASYSNLGSRCSERGLSAGACPAHPVPPHCLTGS